MRGMMGGLASKMGLGGMMPGGPGGMMGGGMPDLSKMDPKQLEALQKQVPGLGGMKGLPAPGGAGLPGLPGGMKLPGLPGLGGGGLPGLGKKK